MTGTSRASRQRAMGYSYRGPKAALIASTPPLNSCPRKEKSNFASVAGASWLGMDPDPALTHLYSCSRWADADPAEVIAEYIRIGEETCRELRLLTHIEDLAYEDDGYRGKDSRSMVDIWGEVKDHLVIFIHGGFWQVGVGLQKFLISQLILFYVQIPNVTLLFAGFSDGDVADFAILVAVNLVKSGVAMAAVGYELASSTWPLSAVVRQVGRAVEVGFYFTIRLLLIPRIQFLLAKYPTVTYITLAGHSAGAQLAFKAYTHLRSPRIQKLALLAGIFDLQELPSCEIGTIIGLTREEAELNSCSAFELVNTEVKVLLLIDMKDSPKLIEQNTCMVNAMKDAGVSVQYHVLSTLDI
ncbi:unnamed protein product [Angiostrongylus costaricensis]|uniref:Abhydrolase_3 domain-containing protein n=1 Tax=Angiostrongylus costaricensis TaxID=334426 RepID=A0A0R3PH86_ANGCS|nr:unnamed protein product [Angiostrongylus costaricensis]